MSSQNVCFKTEPMSNATPDTRPDSTLKPTIRPIDILKSLPHSSSSAAQTPALPLPGLRPIDILKSIRDRQPTSSVSSVPVPDPNVRPIDILAELKARSSLSSTSSLTASTHTPHLRPAGVLPTSIKTTNAPLDPPSRLIAPLPKRPSATSSSSTASQPSHRRPRFSKPPDKTPRVVETPRIDRDIVMQPPPDFLDLTLDSPSNQLPDVIELTDTSADSDECDVDMDANPVHDPEDDILRPADFVFHTNLPIHPRHTKQPWVGTLRPEDWVPSREELHAEQVDFDRSLPTEMLKAGYPKYV